MPDYQNGKIYKLYSLEGDSIYIGSTTQLLCCRKAEHVRSFKSGKGCYSSKLLFQKYNDVRIELLEQYPCENKEQLLKKEGEYIRNNKCVNKVIAGRTQREYQEENRDRLSEMSRKYYEKNIDKIHEKKKEYYEENRDKLIEKGRKYREENKDKINERSRERVEKNRDKNRKYRENNKEKINQRYNEWREKNKNKINERRRENYALKKELNQ